MAAILQEKISWSRPADLPGLEILDVRNSSQRWCIFHQTYTICTITDLGLSRWSYRKKIHHLYNQQLMLIEPGEVHRTLRLEGQLHASFQVVCISPELVEGLAREAGLAAPPHFTAAQSADADLVRAFGRFHAAMAENGGPLLERQSRLTGCVAQLLERHGERRPRYGSPAEPAGLSRARDYLHEHYFDPIALETLARIAGVSRFHFLRIFARQFGLPPHAYQINLRIEKTRELLKAGMPIGEIGTGFSDQSHLTRHFKRVMGVTPGQYAARAAGVS